MRTFLLFMNSSTVFLKLNYQREVCVVSEAGCHCVFQDLRAAEVLSFLHLVFVHRQRSTFSYILNSGMLALNKLASDFKKLLFLIKRKNCSVTSCSLCLSCDFHQLQDLILVGNML